MTVYKGLPLAELPHLCNEAARLDLMWTRLSVFSCHILSLNGLGSAQMKREGQVGNNSRDLVPL